MKMFKKLLASALAGVLALSMLTACSGGGSGSGNGGTVIGAAGKAVMQTMQTTCPTEYKDGSDSHVTTRTELDTTLTNYVNGYGSGSFANRYARKTASSQSVADYFMAELKSDTRSYNADSLIKAVKQASSDVDIMQAAIIEVKQADINDVSKQANALWTDLKDNGSTVYKETNKQQTGNIDTSKAIYLSVSDLFKVGDSYYRIAFLVATQTTT